MKRILVLGAMILGAAMFSGCGYEQVSPGYVAKKVSRSGVEPQVYETGRHYVGWRERLIHIDVSTHLRKAPLKVTMADHEIDGNGNVQQKLGLDMNFLLNVRYRLKSDDDILTAMLKDMKLTNRVDEINAEDIYKKYGDIVVGRVAREVLGRYTPEEVLDNLKDINNTLQIEIKKELDRSPLLVSEASLGPITLPGVIIDRINTNKDMELSEAEKRSAQKIALLEKQNDIELAREQAVREKIDAESMAEQNRILKQSITPEVLRLRELALREQEIKMMEKALSNGGNNTVFIPYGAVDSAGAQMRMFQK